MKGAYFNMLKQLPARNKSPFFNNLQKKLKEANSREILNKLKQNEK